MSNSTWDGEKCSDWFKMGYTQFDILSQVLCHRQLQSLYHPLHSFSFYIFITYACHPPISECLEFHFLASEVIYCLAFCLQSPQDFILQKNLQNVWRCRKKRTQSSLQGSLTVAQLKTSQKLLFEHNLGLLFRFIGLMSLLTFERIV